MSVRRSGILLHPTSLPGPFGVGDLGDEAGGFLRWLEHAGQSLWQILPLGPTGMGNSPYGALSSFAGNPILISPRQLVEDDLLAQTDIEHLPHLPADHVDFGRAMAQKDALLRKAWNTIRSGARPELKAELDEFCADEDTAAWLEDWSIFRALKEKFGGREWTAWDRDLAFREPSSIEHAKAALHDEITFHEFVQWIFFRQWNRVREDARSRGIVILGDLPIYVAFDSADVWANRRHFFLDENGKPTVVAGVPPDYFSATGQRWGNPLYRWEEMKEDGFRWWIARLKANLRLADYIRLDHFRGFAGYWEIPASEETAVHGHWRKGPGRKFFDVVKEKLGDLLLVAEDLGVITPDVEKLLHHTKLPGMKVLQFAFGDIDSVHAPHRHLRESVVYTGTHDNDTTLGWFRSAPEHERRRAIEYLGGDERAMNWPMIRAAEVSVAQWAVVPAQDVFGVGSEGRMNLPGAPSGNWGWRSHFDQYSDLYASRLRHLTELGGRLPGQGTPVMNQKAKET